jgi:hypothetical protein
VQLARVLAPLVVVGLPRREASSVVLRERDHRKVQQGAGVCDKKVRAKYLFRKRTVVARPLDNFCDE